MAASLDLSVSLGQLLVCADHLNLLMVPYPWAAWACARAPACHFYSGRCHTCSRDSHVASDTCAAGAHWPLGGLYYAWLSLPAGQPSRNVLSPGRVERQESFVGRDLSLALLLIVLVLFTRGY